ncbi:protein FAR-RED IMPAIRED RESPONSE 1-like [Panicum virgatum]|uniref:protein FAR-RED IMPAIRED RESPONSE 1-like n=1 Tax=Panicum virgatum TaxID=38727 RepID=UPI0019D5C7DE|nr:protein FAR-RED IMPAIRED RESPONSE 1-like [Panicum virgatum]
MDLNKPPPEFDYDFLDGVESNPSYCTQATPAISSLQVQTHQTDQGVGGTLIADGEHQDAHGFAVNTEEAIGDGVLEEIVEGVVEELVPYEGKDVGNFRSTIRRTEKYKDVQETLDYFRELEQEDPEFFYKIKLDADHRVECLFWVDSAARHAYIESYSDLVSFDATYMTNMDEKTPSYIWLFETFLEAMKGPILDKDEELRDDFKECLNYTVTPDEFETKWSTQRSEVFNAVLKKYVNPNMSVLHFVKQYQKIQDKFLVAQDGQDFRTDDKARRRWSKYPIERHAASVYTKNLFYKFSKEFEKNAEYDVKPKGQFHYWLVPNNNFVYGYGKRNYLVTALEEEESYCCEYSKVDRDGMLCCHILKVMTRLGVKAIPQRYILKRWTQEAVPDNEGDAPNAHVQADFIARDKSSSAPEDNPAELAGPVAIPESVSNPPEVKSERAQEGEKTKEGDECRIEEAEQVRDLQVDWSQCCKVQQ